MVTFSRDHGDETVMRAMLLWAILESILTSAPALVWVGLFQGVRHRRPLRGIFATLHRVVLWPLLGFVIQARWCVSRVRGSHGQAAISMRVRGCS